jgi:hypothetical protein
MTAFYIWCIFTIAIRKPTEFTSSVITITVSCILYFVIAHGIQTLGGFKRLAQTIFALGLFVAFVGAHQGLSPYACVTQHPTKRDMLPIADGRPCAIEPGEASWEAVTQCVKGGQPGLIYLCEKVGLFGTVSIAGRVRYVGQLMDPNELALATSMALPFAFAFFEQRRTTFRLALLLFSLATIALEIVFTQSRGGQITFAAVLGVYFIKKYGWKRGIMAGAVLAVPLVLMGGRSGDEAKASSIERLGCAASGIQMAIHYPITGVGYGQFLNYHFLTAHNAYILAVGELGFLGMVLFVTLVYVSIKVPFVVLQTDLGEGKDIDDIKSMATAMLAAFVGCAVGIFFLSWTYHYVLWINFGMAGALFALIKARYRWFTVRVTLREVGRIAAALFAFLVIYSIYIIRKGAWE